MRSVSRKDIAKLDELMIEYFGIPVVMMMELASYRLAELVRLRYPTKKQVLICAGKGNNGGDGIAAARHLLNFGYEPVIFLLSEELKEEPAQHLAIAKKLDIRVVTGFDDLELLLHTVDLVLDCLLGYNVNGVPRGAYAETILKMNESGKPILACDMPSGVDTDEGAIFEPYIRAETILFLSLPKQGCDSLPAEKYVADMGVPAALYPMIGLAEENLFEKESIIRL